MSASDTAAQRRTSELSAPSLAVARSRNSSVGGEHVRSLLGAHAREEERRILAGHVRTPGEEMTAGDAPFGSIMVGPGAIQIHVAFDRVSERRPLFAAKHRLTSRPYERARPQRRKGREPAQCLRAFFRWHGHGASDQRLRNFWPEWCLVEDNLVDTSRMEEHFELLRICSAHDRVGENRLAPIPGARIGRAHRLGERLARGHDSGLPQLRHTEL